MRRRTLLAALAAGVLVLLALGAVVQWPEPNRVTQENYARIEMGMNRAEVEAILGPPGDYRTGSTSLEVTEAGSRRLQDAYARYHGDVRVVFWQGDELLVCLVFDTAGRVEYTPQSQPIEGVKAAPARRPALAGQAPVAALVPGVAPP
jgi:hypothetical protein